MGKNKPRKASTGLHDSYKTVRKFIDNGTRPSSPCIKCTRKDCPEYACQKYYDWVDRPENNPYRLKINPYTALDCQGTDRGKIGHEQKKT